MAVKRVHLSVHPPAGRVTLVAATETRLEVVRACAISKLSRIRAQQSKLRNQARETPRQYVEWESHPLSGRRQLLSVVEQDTKPYVSLDHRRIALHVRPRSDSPKRAAIVHQWHKSLLHDVVPPLIRKWEAKLKVKVTAYFLPRMKTKWGSCNASAGHIRLNTELVTKPKDSREYVVVHDMTHSSSPLTISALSGFSNSTT